MSKSESRKSELSENVGGEQGNVATLTKRANKSAPATHLLADDIVALVEHVDRAGGGDGSIAVSAEWQASTRRIPGKRYDVRFDSSGSSGTTPRVLIDVTLEPSEGSIGLVARVAAACCELRQRMAGVSQRELRRKTDESLFEGYGVERDRAWTCKVEGPQLSAAETDDSIEALRVMVSTRKRREKLKPNYECPKCKTARVVAKKDLVASVGRWCATCKLPFVARAQPTEPGPGNKLGDETALVQAAMDVEMDAAVAAHAVSDDSGAMHHIDGTERPVDGAELQSQLPTLAAKRVLPMYRPRSADVELPKRLIHPAKGWWKKQLADDHIELALQCGFGCAYCSSNSGMHVVMRKQSTAMAVREQLGEAYDRNAGDGLMLSFPKVIEQLERELRSHRPGYGSGKVLAFSMLTDAFAPQLEKAGITRRALELLLEHTAYRIRVLTKSAVIGRADWVDFFVRHRDRFVVGTSIGTLDNSITQTVEVGTSVPTARVRAHRRLQDHGVATFVMACPILPEHVAGIPALLDELRPELSETVWTEVVNERGDALTKERGRIENWSAYATAWYRTFRERAARDGWTEKLKCLLYEGRIEDEHVPVFAGLAGVLLQGETDDDGHSQHAGFRALQLALNGANPTVSDPSVPGLPTASVISIQEDERDVAEDIVEAVNRPDGLSLDHEFGERSAGRPRISGPSPAGSTPAAAQIEAVEKPHRTVNVPTKRAPRPRPRATKLTAPTSATRPDQEHAATKGQDTIGELLAASNPLSIDQIARSTGLDVMWLEAELARGEEQGLWSRVGRFWQACR